MQTLAISRSRPPVSVAKPFAIVTAAMGLAIIGLGVAVPWITVFRGVQPLSGLSLEGGPLAGIALAAVGFLAVAATFGGGRWLRLVHSSWALPSPPMPCCSRPGSSTTWPIPARPDP